MITATVSPFIDRWHPKKDAENPDKQVCAISIRVTYQRKKRYYPTGMNLSAPDFDRIMTAKRRSEGEKEIYNRIHSFESKARQVVDKLSVFTFDQFEKAYISNRGASDSISAAFLDYAAELRHEGRIGTAVSYEVAHKSLEKFRKDLRFADITKSLLNSYESWMLKNGSSITTVGIYLRCLRSLFNRAEIDKSLYPFGTKKYQIPTGRNIKKALTLDEVARIYRHNCEPGSREMARDYWFFIYLCNGLNVKDLCLLKKSDIKGDFLTFERAKTKRTRKDGTKITVSLKPEALNIIRKWGQRSINPDAYIFPHLKKGLTPERERQLIQQLTQLINKHMKIIAAELGIDKKLSTYYARYAFSNVLKRSGASTEFISEALGHSDLKTTQFYLDGFEKDTLQKTTDFLTAFL